MHIGATVDRGGEPRAPSQAGDAFMPAETNLVPARAVGGLPWPAGIRADAAKAREMPPLLRQGQDHAAIGRGHGAFDLQGTVRHGDRNASRGLLGRIERACETEQFCRAGYRRRGQQDAGAKQTLKRSAVCAPGLYHDSVASTEAEERAYLDNLQSRNRPQKLPFTPITM